VRAVLLKRSRSRTLAARVVMRSRIVLLAADGISASQIARRLGTTPATAALWLRRFAVGGADALAIDASGRGRKRSIAPNTIDDVRRGRTEGLTVREVARRAGISPASVVRLTAQPVICETGVVRTNAHRSAAHLRPSSPHGHAGVDEVTQ
jgi:transposase